MEGADEVLAVARIDPVLPPTELSTCASSEVGICTKRMPRRIVGRGKAGEVADDAAAEGDRGGRPARSCVAMMSSQTRGKGRKALGALARRDDDGIVADAGGLEAALPAPADDGRRPWSSVTMATRARGASCRNARPGLGKRPGADQRSHRIARRARPRSRCGSAQRFASGKWAFERCEDVFENDLMGDVARSDDDVGGPVDRLARRQKRRQRRLGIGGLEQRAGWPCAGRGASARRTRP